MKKSLGFLVMAILFAAGCLVYVPSNEANRPPREDYYQEEGGAYGRPDTTYFYEQLQPYGRWVSYPAYGYVWVPGDVGYTWRPYSRGSWAWTDYGWTWVSVERWGWIAYHYGRWGWERRLGWFWVPDIVWGPAWVAWRWDNMHIGWAPLPPGIAFVPGRGFGRQQWNIPGNSWNFVRGRNFMDRSLDRWILPVERNITIVNQTVINVNINVRDNRVFDDGVDVEHVHRMTNKVVERYSLKAAPRAGEARIEGHDLVLSKPEIVRNEMAKPKQFVAEDKAVEEIDNIRTGRISRQVPRDEGASLRQVHQQETKLLQESQDTEVNEIRRKADQEKAKLQNPAEKQRVDTQARSKIAALKKKHEEEKAAMAERQKAEEAKVKKAPVRKKIDKT